MTAVAAASPRLVVVLADGLRADVAAEAMGYVGALIAAGRATSTRFESGLPSLSRPLYATVLTGQAPVDHGIVTNYQVQGCGETFFNTAHHTGAVSVIAAYHWFLELLTGTAFEPVHDRRLPIPGLNVAGGAWYFEDDYPDSHTFVDAEDLRREHRADLVFIHPMGMDWAGHQHGGESDQYRYAARKLDGILSRFVPMWHGLGYDVILTSDHGMGRDRMHGGTIKVEREVPFVWMPAVAGMATRSVRPESFDGAQDEPVEGSASVRPELVEGLSKAATGSARTDSNSPGIALNSAEKESNLANPDSNAAPSPLSWALPADQLAVRAFIERCLVRQ
jgi:hypothetical protein